MRKLSQYVSLFGIAVLFGGLLILFTGNENALVWQLLALAAGWAISQVGIFLGHRYSRKPRPDEVLDEALKHVARDGRLYHYLLPASHVLLTPTGVIVINAKYQIGKISADGDSWKQSGIGLRKYFGQEGLGNPTKECERLISSMANYIRKNAPQVEELPMAPMIIFTTKDIAALDIANSRIPAMHYSKVKGYLRQQKGKLAPMPDADYAALRTAFDLKAAHLVEDLDGNPA